MRVSTELDNTCRDHRLRAWFPLPTPTTNSKAECAFAVVERGLEAEGGPTEKPMPTYPSRRFVIAGGLTVVHDGFLEYELVDIDSDDSIWTTAGSCIGSHVAALHRRDLTGSDGDATTTRWSRRRDSRSADARTSGLSLWRAPQRLCRRRTGVEDAFIPLLVSRARGDGNAEDRGQALSVEGAEVSAVVREAGQLTVRMFNPSDHETTVRIADRIGWLVDLRGRAIESFDGSFTLGPWKIATAVMSEA